MTEIITLIAHYPFLGSVLALVVLFFIVLKSSVRILQEWERAVVLRLGRFIGVRGGGIIFLIPFIDKPRIVDTRIVTMDVAKQEAMTRDNVPVTVDAVVLFKVVDPMAAILSINDFVRTASLNAQTSLRTVIGQVEMDQLLAERDHINQKLSIIMDSQTEPYGVKVTSVEIRDVLIPDSMKRAMARQAEAEREKRAKIINAEGEFQAAAQLVNAADLIAEQPYALQLRFLQTMVEIASERSTFTILPIPIDLISQIVKAVTPKDAKLPKQE